MSPSALLIWEKLNIAASLDHHGATHAVHFRIFTEAPHSAGHLAGLLLRLATQEDAATLPLARRPTLKALIYSICPSEVHGTAYFFRLERAYRRAQAFSAATPHYTFTPPGTQLELPLTTWPEATRTYVYADTVLAAFQTIE